MWRYCIIAQKIWKPSSGECIDGYGRPLRRATRINVSRMTTNLITGGGKNILAEAVVYAKKWMGKNAWHI